MKKSLPQIALLSLLALPLNGIAEDSHEDHSDHGSHSEKHDEHEGHDAHEEGEDNKHGEKKGHEDHDGHDEGGEHGDEDDDGHDDHEGHGSSKAIGEGKAIAEVNEEQGFKLSPEAIKSLSIKLQNASGNKFEIKKSTLVSSKNLKGIYRFRGGFFKLLPATILKESPTSYSVQVQGIDFGDQIVVDGLGLLRVADVYSTDTSEYGHSH